MEFFDIKFDGSFVTGEATEKQVFSTDLISGIYYASKEYCGNNPVSPPVKKDTCIVVKKSLQTKKAR